ncbi:hypothetical protein FACS1894211_02220 [Clostridia bacterium]|nr:hypothetical protein FACS1894211_02220 [Clostridia bacterium]
MIKYIELKELCPYIRLGSFVDASAEEFHVPWRMIYDYELYYVTKGAITVETAKGAYELTEGDLHMMRPFTWHRRYAKHNIKYYNLHFDFVPPTAENDFSANDEYRIPCILKADSSQINTRLENRTIYEPRNIRLPDKMRLKNPENVVTILGGIVNHIKQKDIGYELILTAEMLKLVHMIVCESENKNLATFQSYSNNVIAQYMQFIYENFTEKLYLEELAAQYGFFQSHMRNLFTRINNVSPREFLINLRIERAKEMLEEGKYRVKEIGGKVGFEGEHYFSRIFKKKTGQSPLAYRNEKLDFKRKECESAEI